MWWMGLRAAVLGVLLAVTAAGAAQAGPWPRAPGAWFVAPEFSIDRSADLHQLRWQIYLERGLHANWVLGGKLEQDGGWRESLRASGQGMSRSRAGAELFLRYHPDLWRDHLASGVELALRSRPASEEAPRSWQPRGALHLGRGFELPGVQAWTRLSLDAAPARPGQGWDWGGMAQAGLDWPELGLVWLSAGVSRTDGTIIRRLTLSGGYRVTVRTTLTLGYSQTSGQWREQGLRLGLWQSF